jgi:hypothetical protein
MWAGIAVCLPASAVIVYVRYGTVSQFFYIFSSIHEFIAGTATFL